MIDERDVREMLHRRADAISALPVHPPAAVRRARRRLVRNGVAGVLAAAAVTVVALAGVGAIRSAPVPADPPAPSPIERVGFVGVPPLGAEPSTPTVGELILSVSNYAGGLDDRHWQVYIYADGRVVWLRNADLPEGANILFTGLLEQRLSAEGVDLLRSEILSTGLFEKDLGLVRLAGAPDPGDRIDPAIGLEIQARIGGELVGLNWTQVAGLEGFEAWPLATPAQTEALERLGTLLTPPIAWLPETAWSDREISPYVPSRYSVCLGSAEGVAPSRVLSRLPSAAAEALHPGRCTDLTTDEARLISESLDVADLARVPVENNYRLTYEVYVPGQAVGTIWVSFHPYFPHGGAALP